MKKTILFVLIGCLFVAFGCGQNVGKKSMDALNGKEGVFAVMKTNRGEIVLELYYKDTPLTVVNFAGLAEGTLDAAKGKPYYDGLKFHRVISKENGDGQDFMIQGGDPTGTGAGGPGYRFPDEIVSKYKFDKAGILAMANAGPGTNGSQFFITHVPTGWLNGKHTIFGKVIEGQDIVNKTLQNDTIESVKIIRQGADAEKFTATQKDFDSMVEKLRTDAKAKKEAQYATQVQLINKKWPDYEKDENGIFFKVTKEGKGDLCGSKKNVKVEYKGYLLDGTVFDQSKGREPLEFTTDGGQMIPGFDVMVQQMKLGEQRTIILPPDMAYGEAGYPGVIPPASYICFDVELVSAK